MNLDTHKVIALIYETAIDGEKWPDLLDALAYFIQPAPISGSTAALPTHTTDQVSLPDNSKNASLSLALRHLCPPDITSTTRLVAAGNEQEEVNQLLLGHFSKALKITRQLIEHQEKHEATLSLLDQLPIALIVVDKGGAMVESNLRARQLLAESNILYFYQGLLQATDRGEANNLRQIIMKLANSAITIAAPEAITLSGKSDDKDNLMLILSPAKASILSDSNHVSIFISSKNGQAIVLPDTIRHHFGLTDMEFVISTQLVHGFSIKEVAEKNGTQENTVRSQVKAIFLKTNTRRQAELIALLLGGNGSAIGYGLLSQGGAGRAAAEMADQVQMLSLPTGRQMAYQEYGDPNGEPVIFCHSALGSRLELPYNGAEEAAARHIRLIIPDRPGRGRSTPDLDGNILQWTDDLRALADHLGLATFAIMGYAMGGLFAYASAYAMPERIKQVVLISSGQTPQSDEDFHAMQPLYSMIQKLARDLPRINRLLLALMIKSFTKNPRKLIDRLAQKVCDADKQVLRHADFHDLFVENLIEAYCQGANHYAHEVELGIHPENWGFTPHDISTPIQMWHGRQDISIPLILAEKFQRQAPNARLTVLADKGHYLFYDHWPLILDHLLAENFAPRC